MTTMAAAISSGSALLPCCAASAVPWKPPRTLFGMAMSASACWMSLVASDRLKPSLRLKAMVVAISPSWWLIDVAAELSANLAMADSGTIVVGEVLSAEPLEASRTAGAATLAAKAGVLAAAAAALAVVVDVVDELPPVAGTVKATGAPVGLADVGAGKPFDGTYRSFSASGLREYCGATSMMTWYWFSSS